VLFFKRILNFTPDAIARKDKRQNTRFPVGQGFPVKALLNLAGRDGNGMILDPDGHNGQDWGGWMLNLSSTGASMQLHPAAITTRGEVCGFQLTFESHRLEINARVAHFRAYPNFSVCGVALEFQNAEIQKAYLQLLEPIVVGASFKPVDPKRIKQDTPDLKKEQYQGDSDTRLTVWRSVSVNAIAGFDLQIGTYSVSGSSESPGLDVTAATGESGEPTLTAASKEEVRLLFHWIVPNLAKSIPSDVRKFLAKF
jgi:hypothetical protein